MPHLPRIRSAALALAATAALAVGACQSASPAPELRDPREILAAAVTATTTAKTVRIDATADGTLTLDLLGAGAASTIELTGTTASADLDLAAANARATFASPGLLGLTGEIIAVDGTTYIKSSLTGTRYQVLDEAGAGITAPSSDVRATVLDGLTSLLANPTLDPVKHDDEPCGSATCYRVDIALAPADLAVLGIGEVQAPAGLPIPVQLPDLSAANVDIRILVAKDTTRLSGMKVAVDFGNAQVAIVDLTFSKWDEPVSITAPPPDELAPSD
jgi:hypothetical protein